MSDPYSANVSLLLHMEGSNGSTTFTDSSFAPKTITRYGNAQISTAQSKWGNGSGYFDGSGDYLTATIPAVGSGNATFETHFMPIDSGKGANYARLFQVGNRLEAGGFTVLLSPDSPAKIYFALWTPSETSSATTTITNNVFSHLALVKNNTTWKLYLNGSEIQSVTNSMSSSFTNLYVATSNLLVDTIKGYFQDFRITLGIARYTENFTPPAARLPDPDPVTGLILPSGYRHDLYDGGAYRIAGNVDELGVAGSYRVRLFDRQSGRCVRETWSAADGSYTFNYIDYRYQGYFAIAFDRGDNPLNAAIADLITPEPMP